MGCHFPEAFPPILQPPSVRRRVPRGFPRDLQLRERVKEILRDRMIGTANLTLHRRNRFCSVRRAKKPEHQVPSSGLVVQAPEQPCQRVRRFFRAQKSQSPRGLLLLVASRVLVGRCGLLQLLGAALGTCSDHVELDRVRAQRHRLAPNPTGIKGTRFARHPMGHHPQPIVSRPRLSPFVQLRSRGKWLFRKLPLAA